MLQTDKHMVKLICGNFNCRYARSVYICDANTAVLCSVRKLWVHSLASWLVEIGQQNKDKWEIMIVISGSGSIGSRTYIAIQWVLGTYSPEVKWSWAWSSPLGSTYWLIDWFAFGFEPCYFTKFQMVPRLILLKSSGSKMKEPRYTCLWSQSFTFTKNVGRSFILCSTPPA